MTRLAPDAPCQACGGMLVPSALAKRRMTLPLNTEYVCIECGSPHCWEGTPPKLVVAKPAPAIIREA